MSEKTGTDGIDSTNIFDEFSQDEQLKNEVKDAQKKKEKGSYYYLSIFNSFLGSINLFLFLLFIGLSGYIYVQNNESLYNSSILNPVCGLLIGDSAYEETNCSSVKALLGKYTAKKSDMENIYYDKIIDSVDDVYYISNFVFSKEILFLLDRSSNRATPLKVLQEFDRLKNEFEPINKAKLKCSDLGISQDSILTMKCEAYSSRWDRKVIGPSGMTDAHDSVKGTSISVASSFINYLEKHSDSFVLLEKPKKFSFDEVVDYGVYTRKTDFELRLKLKTNTIGLLK